jgi:superoxide reductase
MTERMQIFKCDVCGNIIEVVNEGVGQLVCCGEPMILLEVHSSDQGYEKHVPVIERTPKGVKIKVGANPHPMLEEHHIEWIEICYGNGVSQRKFLKAGDPPEVEFCVPAAKIKAREHCNIHGLWWAKE